MKTKSILTTGLLCLTSLITHAAISTPTACGGTPAPLPATSETVFVGGIDSGVTDFIDSEGVALSDRVAALEEAPYANNEEFVTAIIQMGVKRVMLGEMTKTDLNALYAAAIASGIGA